MAKAAAQFADREEVFLLAVGDLAHERSHTFLAIVWVVGRVLVHARRVCCACVTEDEEVDAVQRFFGVDGRDAPKLDVELRGEDGLLGAYEGGARGGALIIHFCHV